MSNKKEIAILVNIKDALLGIQTITTNINNFITQATQPIRVNFINPDGMEIDEALYHVQRLQE